MEMMVIISCGIISIMVVKVIKLWRGVWKL